MSTVSLAARALVRYALPLLALSAIALAPVVLAALAIPVAADPAHARAQLWLAWALVASALILQLVLVGGAAPAVRAIAHGETLSQRRAFASGARSMARALVPCLVATIAIALGTLALAVPGLVLIVLLAHTGASQRLGEPFPAPLADSARAARTNLARAAVIVAAIVVLDIAIAGLIELVLVRSVAKSAAVLAAPHHFARVTMLVLVVASPVVACVLAASYESSQTP